MSLHRILWQIMFSCTSVSLKEVLSSLKYHNVKKFDFTLVTTNQFKYLSGFSLTENKQFSEFTTDRCFVFVGLSGHDGDL